LRIAELLCDPLLYARKTNPAAHPNGETTPILFIAKGLLQNQKMYRSNP